MEPEILRISETHIRILTIDQAVSWGEEVYSPRLHQNCMNPENITLYPLEIEWNGDKVTVSDHYGMKKWITGEKVTGNSRLEFKTEKIKNVILAETVEDVRKRKKRGKIMNYSECIENARTRIGNYCKACPECNGRACKNQMPGPGAKGIGDTAIRNYDKWKEIRVQMDTIAENKLVDTSLELFGKKFLYPFFAGPVGAVGLHYGDCLDDVRYNDILVSACAKYGIAAFTGDGLDSNVMVAATKAIGKTDGIGIPTVKPWNIDTVAEKMKMVQESKAFAVAMDVDAAGLPFLKNMEPPAGSKTVEELGEIAKIAGIPFIVKGVMTVRGALKAKEAGASAIVVSNHGGRVLDQCPATAEVLEEIARAVGDSMKIFVDGGIRSGVDVFKALALGADAVIIARPFVTAVYGGAEEGVKSYIDKIGTELEDTMKMCGVTSLKEITRASVWMK